MTASVPAYASCDGGLILNSNRFDLLNMPGVATRLRNFEVALSGGYRRINGYLRYGDTQPSGASNILGVHPYALGLVVCAGEGIYYTEDGETYLQINRDTTEAGAVESELSGLDILPRNNQGKAQFVLAKGTTDHATNPYGVLSIATGPNKLVHFHINGVGPTRTFHYVEIEAPLTAKWITAHEKHLCVVDTENEPNTVHYSAINDYKDFSGTGSGSVVIPQKINGIRSFRDSLYIFCENSIHRLVNINDTNQMQVLPVTGNLGCMNGYSIQEVGGDLIFLAPDGLRTIAGTERLSDVELGSVSRAIQPLLNEMIGNLPNLVISSVVLREKNQYRLYYLDSSGVGRGFIGTLRTNAEGMTGYQWSETLGIPVYSITSYFDSRGTEVTYHGGADGYIYRHDVGNSFNGVTIPAEYRTPDVHFGDLGMRKTLSYLNLSIDNTGSIEMSLEPKFDFNSTEVIQPQPKSILIDTATNRYGTARYGQARYGQAYIPMTRIPIQGSGNSVSFKFFSNDTNPSYTINGYHVEIMPSGRK